MMFTLHSSYRYILPAMLLSAAMVSCSDDDTPDPGEQQIAVNWATTSNTYDSDGVWSDNAENVPLYGSPFRFSHSISEWDTVEGFTLSRSTDTDWHEVMYLHSYTVPAGGGPEGPGTPFVVGFWSNREGTEPENRSCSVAMRDGSTFTPGTIYVTNTCYAYYDMRRGSDFSKAFAEGDWFHVTAHGVPAAGGTETTSVFALADCGADPAEGIVSTWQEWDLSALGEVSSIYFTLESSDSGEFGMNTPAYFAISGMSCLSR